jgi:hypothetical protein
MFKSIVIAAIAVSAIAFSSPVSAQVGTFGMNDVWQLGAPTISDKEAAEMTRIGDSIQTATLIKRASAPTPNCSVASLEAIYPGNKPLIMQIAYGKENVNKIIQAMTMAEIASRYQKAQQAVGTTAIAATESEE